MKQFHQAVLALISIPIPPPYLFFNETKEEPVKLEISPKPSTTQQNFKEVNWKLFNPSPTYVFSLDQALYLL